MENGIMVFGTINILDKKIGVKLLENFVKYWGITTGGRATIMKQLLKELHKQNMLQFDKVWVSSETFSGGNAIRVNTLNSDKKTNEIIQSICNEFEHGSLFSNHFR